MILVGEAKEVREQAVRWLEEGQTQQLGVMLRILQDYDRFREAAESAEKENEQLRGLVYENEKLLHRAETSERECEQLRDEVGQLRAANERHRRDREEVADALTRVLNDALLRLRSQAA